MVSFEDVVNPPDDELVARYRHIESVMRSEPGDQALQDAFAEWERVRRAWTSYVNVTRLRFAQDTTKGDVRAEQRALDQRLPRTTALEAGTKRRFLAPLAREPLLQRLGKHAFDVWSADVATFDEAIADDLVAEAALTREYTQSLAAATAPFGSGELTLSGLAPHLTSAEREVRHAAESARWAIFERHAERLDGIYDELVHLRDGMATKLGFPDYTTLRYRAMRRIDYGTSDVARYRDEIVRVVVPLAREYVERYGAAAGFERVYFWDEAALPGAGALAPLGDLSWTIARMRESLAAIDPALGEFGEALFEGGMFDVEYRPGKRRGAFCTDIPVRNSPFIFANYAGSARDVRTLVHELGHAFQRWQSRGKPALDYLYPTSESAEIHSMALEYLAWPQMERFFGDAAGVYRRQHLFDAILFIPYGAAVDHFQHLVYAHPGASPQERHEMWRELEHRYLPWRDYGDLAFPRKGGLWQEKPHIYLSPFYYIDYTVALCCALQFWQQADDDRGDALARYVALCRRGGEAPFQTLVRSAGLRSPFEPGVLEGVVSRARASL